MMARPGKAGSRQAEVPLAPPKERIDMQNSKQLIPRVSLAALTLGATAGCNKTATPDSVADKFCSTYRDCEPEEFAEYFGSLRQCTDLMSERFQEYVDLYTEYYGSRCGQALLDYYDCLIDSIRDCSFESIPAADIDRCYAPILRECDF
jgi:hypothetical protein